MEMFNPSDEDALPQNTDTALVHYVEVEENPENQGQWKDEVLCLIRT